MKNDKKKPKMNDCWSGTYEYTTDVNRTLVIGQVLRRTSSSKSNIFYSSTRSILQKKKLTQTGG